MIPWDDLAEQEPPPPEKVRKSKPTEREIKRIAALNDARRAATKSCGRKRAYQSFGVAKAVAQKSLEKRQIPLYPYECLTCGKWHLTHTRPR